jgi:hypothetical protein
MGKSIAISRQTRNNFIQLINSLTTDQLNQIPSGMNNNIAWNFGHIIVTQQILCYTLAGLEPKMDESLVSKYRKGAKPDDYIDSTEIETLKSLASSLLDELESDLQKNIFNQYKTYTTSYGFELTSIEDAVDFFIVHESMHMGVAITLKKMLQ